MNPLDRLGRPLHDLRISVTDRCNFRCTYCMPKEVFGRDYAFLPRTRSSRSRRSSARPRAFVELGVEKLRITGGEPLVRRDLPALIRMLAALRTPDGRALDLTLTTNGAGAASARRAAGRRGPAPGDGQPGLARRRGLRRDERRRLPGRPGARGIDAALDAGLGPVKVNMVVRRGVNEASIVPMARWARETGVTLRFIEYMDVGHSNGWRLDEVVPAGELIDAVAAIVAGRTGRARLPRRGRRPLALSRWARRVRRHLVGDAAVLPRLHAGAPVRRRHALHVPVRGRRPRCPGRPARRRDRRGAGRRSWRHLAGARRPLFRAAVAVDDPICPRSRCSRWAAERSRSSTGLSTARPQLADPVDSVSGSRFDLRG